MAYLLVLVIVGGGNAGNQSLRVGHYRTLESCEAAANDANGHRFAPLYPNFDWHVF
jgi:hypothetical protein